MTLARQKVLIVEDSPHNAQLLAMILAPVCDTQIASDAETALARIPFSTPDLILLDIVLPGMDGHEVCRRLKSDPRTHGVPIIFLTGLQDLASEERGLALGAIDYIVKPFHPPTILMRVRNHLELKRRGDLLAELAHIDPLTGLANRRRIDAQLELEWRRCHRQQESLAMLYIDIDHFKQYNDLYGHPDGDLCLRWVGDALQGCLNRAGDLLSRYGGEEFVALLAETDLEGAGVVAKACVEAVRHLRLPHAGSAVADIVTISVGGAAIVPEDRSGAMLLLQRADQHLYQAKQGGRDRALVL